MKYIEKAEKAKESSCEKYAIRHLELKLAKLEKLEKEIEEDSKKFDAGDFTPVYYMFQRGDLA